MQYVIFQSPNRGTQKTHSRHSSEGLTGHSLIKSSRSDGLFMERGSTAPTRLSTSVSLNRHGFIEQTSVSRELFITSPGQSNENSSPGDAPSEPLSWAKEPTNSPAKLEAMVIGDNEENCDADNELQTFPYELLKVSSEAAAQRMKFLRSNSVFLKYGKS
ncbi:hypothetical protein MA16_Dca021478 [Dendrobium catenatum]|uniref:Uncharacterized protein n=1 Tax=Dendrobium catenatum TaxID=906689 RepID=A0A2I0WZ69_9ASPA|nr:hypothetical protein MA16_Dca021478 [Dendrobium catenatum]